ncbi:MAG TPA: hypothetical protein VFN68_13230, partial [Acidimicrobiales bacterium]|nr:hypothetical protein [Acidimicrobiales bacterium]
SVPPDPSNSYLIFVADTPGGVSVQEGSIYVPVGSAGVSANVAAPPPTTATTTTTTPTTTTSSSTTSTTTTPTTVVTTTSAT